MNKVIDVREMPSYRFKEASHYLRIPVATIRAWTLGQDYSVGQAKKRFRPIVKLPGNDPKQLSFLNLCEIHILDAIRKEHEISLQKIRKSLEYLEKDLKIERPLINAKFLTDGVSLFISKYGELLDITQHGQFAMKTMLEAYLKRIEYDEKGTASRIFPFTRKRDLNEPRVVVIDPFVSFGRPVLAGTGIATAVIAERYKAGESIEALARDYGRNGEEIQEAIRCELSLSEAA